MRVFARPVVFLLAILAAMGCFQLSGAAAAEPPVTALAMAPDGDVLLVGSQAGLTRLAWPSLRPRGEVLGMPEAIHSLTFAGAGDALAIGGGTPAEEGQTIVLRWPETSVRWRDKRHGDVVYATAWSADSQRIATASLDGMCRVMASADGEDQSRIAGHSAGLIGVAWLDDAQLITASRDATLRIWTAHNGALVRTLNNHTGELTAVASAPGAAQARPLVASGGADRTLRFWQPTIGRLVRFAKLDAAHALCLAWAPDGQWIAAGTTSGRVLIVDPATAAVVRSLQASKGWVTAIVVTDDGRAIAAGSSDGSIVRLIVD